MPNLTILTELLAEFRDLLIQFQSHINPPLDFEFIVFMKIVLVLGCFALLFSFYHLYKIKKSSIAQSLFSYVFISLVAILYYYILISGYFMNIKIKLLLLLIFLVSFLGFGIKEMGGLKNLLTHFEYRLLGYQNKPIGLDTVFLVWHIYRNHGETYFKTKLGHIHYSSLMFAWLVVFLFVIKELIKRVIIYFVIAAFYKCFFIEALFYITNYLLVIFIVSLIAIDKDIVNFIGHYFGPYVLGWLGSYQYISPNKKFMSANDFKWTLFFNQKEKNKEKDPRQNKTKIS